MRFQFGKPSTNAYFILLTYLDNLQMLLYVTHCACMEASFMAVDKTFDALHDSEIKHGYMKIQVTRVFVESQI